ncbi:DUF887-domain-containing protein [Coniophora puteana RWD-64-598 SS2]|uniref:DUF887-domain-containing protein n=1 Tax=Coniophora puteana (strain RWD-64-598) TaxID=741705 RepID=A0A5M3N0L1_CONPW|nr:DUF887-domain-containing protein [Coniophora puteana RWD-64-598 SS2]EIW84922.1 DUF887-domain-containing protein [Coniophora puteana RWD-64-598 SS2]
MLEGIRAQLRVLAQPLAAKSGLQKIPDYADVIVFSTLFFTFVHLVLSPLLSSALFPSSYAKAGKRVQHNWDIHVVSLVHAVVIIVLSGRCLMIPALDADRAFGWDDQAGYVIAIACGYFIWDLVDSIVEFTDIGFVLHGFSCTLIYGLAFRPFLQYYGLRFLFWELSTVFLNIHWFLDKTGQSGSQFQLLNGICLLATFFSVRLIWGGKMSFDFWHTLGDIYNQLPIIYSLVYGVGNVVLQSLNWLWFTKMITALRKRFTQTTGHANEHANGNGHINGTKKSKLN